MGHQIPGNPVFPIDFTIPDDGDARSASSVNVPFEALADRTAWLKANTTIVAEIEFIANGSFTWPFGATHAIFDGYGGGGGGGKGANGPATTHTAASGGGGGGGAIRRLEIVAPSTPVVGEQYDVTIGVGGAGGTSGSGANGGDTIVARTLGGIVARFRGAEGGQAGSTCEIEFGGPGTSGITQYAFGLGGSPIKRTLPSAGDVVAFNKHTFFNTTPQAGGNGYAQIFGADGDQFAAGNPAPSEDTVGGTGGTSGVVVGVTIIGGGGGGGGGAGPAASGGLGLSGGNGGNGSDAALSGSTSNGGAGTSAGATTGAGGGGGGGAGAVSSGPPVPGVGGNGGNGGSGYCRVIFIRREG
jgi:hypothetical protein